MKRAIVLTVVLASILLLTPLSVGAGTSPRLNGRYAPIEGNEDSEYSFIVTYTDLDNDAPTSISLFINGVERTLVPVDGTDTNFSDGKDYSHKTRLAAGVNTYYFKAASGNDSVNTATGMVTVRGDGFFDTEHGDLIQAAVVLVPLIVVVLAIGLWELHRISKALKQNNGSADNGQKSPKDDATKE